MRIYARRKAREFIVQALYQWQVTQDSANSLEAQFESAINPRKVDVAYFNRVLEGCLAHAEELNNWIVKWSQRELSQLTMVEKAVLMLAFYEMAHVLEVPYQVIIDEALELDKHFGAAEGFKLVNGVLDQAAKALRLEEYRKNKEV